MKFSETENWADPVTYSGLLFFAQRLEELTYEYTIDSYKAPTTNAPFLVGECINQLNDCIETKRPINSALHILDELEDRLKQNIVAKSIVSLRIENFINTDRTSILDLKRRLSVLRREIDPRVYVLRVMEMVGPLAKTNKKHDLNFLARELATTLIGLKVSPFHINLTVKNSFFSKSIVNDEGVLDDFFRNVFPHVHNFTVCFKIRTLIDTLDERVLKRFKTSLSDSAEGIFTISELPKGFSAATDNQKFISVKDVMATDTHSAIQSAHERVARLHDLFRLFHHKAKFEIDDSGIAEQNCCAGEINLVPAHVNRMQFISDKRPKAAAKELNRLTSELNLPNGPEKHKFFRVIDFHGMSLGSEIVENQILNLWTSFETIVPEDTNKTIISNVTDRITPFIGLQYFRRLFKSLTFDIIRWDRRSLIEPLKDQKFNSSFDLVDKIFCLVVLPEFEDRLDDFIGRTGSFELLKYRIFQLNKNFSNPRHALATLKRHQRRVEWQINRIYRTRNSIVHSGETPKYAGIIVDNAHDYFDQVFNLSCEISSGIGGFRTFSECFDYSGFQYNQYTSDLASMTAYDLDSAGKLLWRPRVVPTKRRLFPKSDED